MSDRDRAKQCNTIIVAILLLGELHYMTDYYEMQQEAAWEEYREELIEDALKEISQDGIWTYLFHYGDAIEVRIQECLKTAAELDDNKYFGSSVVCSCMAIEVTIRYFLLTPLLQGMFLNEEWAETLTSRILSGQTTKDRLIVPSILRLWQVDVNSIKLSSGEPLWQHLHDKIWKARNRYVHRGDPVSNEMSAKALESAILFSKVAEETLLKALNQSKNDGRWGGKDTQRDPFS